MILAKNKTGSSRPLLLILSISKDPDTIDFWIRAIMRDYMLGYIGTFTLREERVNNGERVTLITLLRDPSRSRLFSMVRESRSICISALELEEKDDLLIMPTSMLRDLIANLFQRYETAVSTTVAFTYGLIMGQVLLSRVCPCMKIRDKKTLMSILFETAKLMGLFRNYHLSEDHVEVELLLDPESEPSRCPFTYGFVKSLVEGVYSSKLSLCEPERKDKYTYIFHLCREHSGLGKETTYY